MNRKKEVMPKEELIIRLLDVFNVKENKGLAVKFGVKPSTITSWKNGDNSPQYENILQKNELSGINLHWLLTGEGEKFLKDVQAKSPQDRRYEDIGRMVELIYKRLKEE